MSGAAAITPLHLLDLRARLADWYGLPAHHPRHDQTVVLPTICYLITLPHRTILVDAAAHDLPPEEAALVGPGPPRPALPMQLAAAAVPPGAVTDVVLTHNHFDHINGLTVVQDGERRPLFPCARHYLGAADWQPGHLSRLEANTLGVVATAGLLQPVAGQLALGDGLALWPMPGETPGHQVLALQHDGGQAIFAGDLFHHALEFDEPERDVKWAAPAAMRASKAQLAALAAAGGARVYFTHLHGSYRVVGRAPAWQWRPA